MFFGDTFYSSGGIFFLGSDPLISVQNEQHTFGGPPHDLPRAL